MSSADSDAQDTPWKAEREVDASTALALIREAAPELGATQIESFGAGWDNTAWLVDGSWVFRFPRRSIAVELLAAENRVLPLIASHLPLPVPVPEVTGKPSERFPWPFAGYRLLPGTTACRARLSETEASSLAVPLAYFMSALHTLPAELVRETNAPNDTMDRLGLARRRLATAQRLQHAAAAGLLPDATPWLHLLDALPDTWQLRTDRLVHGDLYVRHLLVDDHKKAAGIIDWGDVHLGEPALDLSFAYTFLPVAARHRFFDVYREQAGDVDEITHHMARFRALISALTILVYGHDIGDRDLAREGRLGLNRLLADTQRV